MYYLLLYLITSYQFLLNIKNNYLKSFFNVFQQAELENEARKRQQEAAARESEKNAAESIAKKNNLNSKKNNQVCFLSNFICLFQTVM